MFPSVAVKSVVVTVNPAAGASPEMVNMEVGFMQAGVRKMAKGILNGCVSMPI